ncbi:metalloregulator ArsR/SmtB family transcription factor [Canibacter oris]|uniref:DNA-binding transcriptional ArsR family regulator n=1 Tax=Canibacter oris TaxID=1365628 RepID=A0A840DMS5_9MICO|nr:DNA-binding transcriptional ArsR family regulator [Canibacter oris]
MDQPAPHNPAVIGGKHFPSALVKMLGKTTNKHIAIYLYDAMLRDVTTPNNTTAHPDTEVDTQLGIQKTAALFKQLGNEARLRILLQLSQAPASVTELVTNLGISQPLASQHLRSLRESDLVASEKHGKVVIYRLADDHVTHIVCDALAHTAETLERNPK